MQLPPSLRYARDKKTLVILSQVYVPDPAAVGQYMHDVAAEMVRRGYRVVVFTADRGYDDSSEHYPRYERIDGVHVVRVPLASFGKSSLAVRLLGGGIFVAEATLLAAALPRIDRVLVSTSPPMCASAGVALSILRRAPLLFLAMDINPDQIVVTGALAKGALPVRALDWLNRKTLAQSNRVVALDRFMAERLVAKLDIADKLLVVPPWPLFDSKPLVLPGDSAFRREHDFGDKRVLMYSGNLSPVHPVQTILEAARALRHDERFLFVVIGGGLGRPAIERYVREHHLTNIRLLPYQPLSELADSLSAADLHLVSMGEPMVGIVHPSKIYGAMAVGRPILALGPAESHIAELVQTEKIGWHVTHGDVGGARQTLRDFLDASATSLIELGKRAHEVVARRFAKQALLTQFCDCIDDARFVQPS